MTIPLSGFSGGVVGSCPDNCDGITSGDAVRYNPLPYDINTEPSGEKYTKSKGDIAQHSEVVGVIEEIDEDNDSVTVVIAGQIKYPTEKLVNATHIDPDMGDTTIIGASGGNDIYFLSEVTAGKLQNLAPITPGTVAKPVLQIAPDGVFTGQVVNYIGYQIGGNVVGEETFSEPAGTYASTFLFGDDDGSSLAEDGWINATQRNWFPITIDDLNYQGDLYVKSYKAFGAYAGVRYKVTISGVVGSSLSTIINEKATQKNSSRTIIGKYNIVDADNTNNILWLEGPYNLDNSKKIHIGTKTYTIESSSITAFANPISKSRGTTRSSFVDMNNNPLAVREVPFLKIPADGKGLAVTLVPNATFDSITIKKQIDVENTAYRVTDLTQTIKEIGDTVQSLEEKINNQTPIFTTRITTK